MPAPSPFYIDWTFWTAVVALLAVVLSQLPPIHVLLRPKRLDVEVNSRIQVTHKVGNPNVSIHVSITNSGGRELRIRSLSLEVTRDEKHLFSLPAQNYFQGPNDKVAALFVPFSLRPGEYWSHGINFLNLFDRSTEKAYRENSGRLVADIRQRIAARPEADKNPVIADPDLVTPFVELFNRLFPWEPGEYVVTLVVKADPGSASYSKRYRFTLYESDTAELRKHLEDYKYGGGISYNVDQHAGAFVPLSENVG